MGGGFSIPSSTGTPNNTDSSSANSANSTTTMSDSHSKTLENPKSTTQSSDSAIPSKTLESEHSDTSKQEVPEKKDGEEEEEEEEEGECGFCLFMKGGGCKESFIAWEKCVEEGEKNKEDIVDKCYEVTDALKKCMEAHSDYYQPVLIAEERAKEDVIKELEKEKEPNYKVGSDPVSGSDSSN